MLQKSALGEMYSFHQFSLTHYREEQEATEVEKLVGILQANLIIEEVVGEKKYCFSEGEGVAKGDDVGVNAELASDLAHVLFSEEDSFGEEATKSPTSDLLLWSDNVHLPPLYRGILQASGDYSGDDDLAYSTKIREVQSSVPIMTYKLDHLADIVATMSNAIGGIVLLVLGTEGFSMAIHTLKPQIGTLTNGVFKPTVTMLAAWSEIDRSAIG